MILGLQEPLNFVHGLLNLGASIRWPASRHTATRVNVCLEMSCPWAPAIGFTLALLFAECRGSHTGWPISAREYLSGVRPRLSYYSRYCDSILSVIQRMRLFLSLRLLSHISSPDKHCYVGLPRSPRVQQGCGDWWFWWFWCQGVLLFDHNSETEER
jgi:hypothetical protein